MVKNLLSILALRQTTILSGATIIMATVILSKVLGLVRDRLLAHIFPPDNVAIFFAAFGLPDLIFQIFIFGALSVAFIPVFTETLEKTDKEEAFEMANAIFNLILIILILMAVVIFIFAEPLTNLIVPGFSIAQKIQVANITRIILVGQIILSFGSFFIGILQSFQRFIIPALAGVFYNIGIIIGILLLSESMGIEGAAVGVIIGGILHVLIQLPLALSLGFRFSLTKNVLHKGVREIIRLMSVRTIGLAAEQINERVAIALSSLISTSSVTYLTFAQHLQLVPVSLFGATIAQAALPILSYERARGRSEEFKSTLLTTLHQILFLALPSAAILIVLRIPSVRLVFGAQQFDWEATVLTGRTLAFLSIGLGAQAISLLLARAFYAFKDTRTPVYISLFVVLVNIILSFVFIKVFNMDVWGLGLAFSIANILSSVLLFITLNFKVGGFEKKQAFAPLGKMLMATIIMGVALYIPIKLLDQVIFDTTKTVNLLILTGISSLFAITVYVVLVWFMKVKELKTYVDLLGRVAKYQNNLKPKEMINPDNTTV
jgi:putative peptidoglycan lipid II flippase